MKTERLLLPILSLILALALPAGAATTALSTLTNLTLVSTNDDLIVNATNAGVGTWTTKRATVGKVIEGALPLIQSRLTFTDTNALRHTTGAATNPIIYAIRQLPIRWTNQFELTGADGSTNHIGLMFPETRSLIHFEGTNNHDGQISWWTDHGEGYPELLFDVDGSVRWNFKWIQFGAPGGQANTFIYHNYQAIGAATNLSESVPYMFSAPYWSNSVWMGNSGSMDEQQMPAFHYKAEDINGNGAFGFYSKMPNSWHGVPLTSVGAVRQHYFQVGPNPGLVFSGGVTNDGVAGITKAIFLDDLNVITIRNGLTVGHSAMDADASNYCARAGITTVTAKAAFNNFVYGLKTANLWTNLSACWPMYGTNATATAQNLRSTNYTITWSGALSGNTNHSLSGVTNQGAANSWGDTGFNPTTAGLATNDLHLMVWAASNPTLGGGGYSGDAGCALGLLDYLPTSYSLILIDTNSIFVHGPNSTGSSWRVKKNHGGNALGFICTSPLIDSVQVAFHNTTAFTDASGGGNWAATVGDHNFGLFAMGSHFGTEKWLALKLSGASIGHTLTSAQTLTYYALWAELQTALGR